MKLPNADKAIIREEKLRDYILSLSHPVGRFKAAFFGELGYTSSEWERLKSDIRTILGNEATIGERTEYGQKYEVSGTIATPSGRTATITTAWIVLKGESDPQFIAAYPGERT